MSCNLLSEGILKIQLDVHVADSITTLTFRVSEPVVNGDETVCEICTADGATLAAIIGIDPINALENAISFIRSYLKNLKGELFWKNGQKYIDL
jgi:hypothetical protein